MKRLLLSCLLCLPLLAGAAGFALNAPPALAVADRTGVQLPLDIPLRDAAGHPVRLGDFFVPGRPVLLLPGYWRCRNLCGTLMQGVLEAAADTGLPRSAYAVVGFSVDPDETPADAAARQQSDLEYAAAYGSRATRDGTLPPPDFHLLLDAHGRGAVLARTLGFDWQRSDQDDPADRWWHAAGFAVVSPQGRVVRSFEGVRFDPKDLRLALQAAAGGPPLDSASRLSALGRGVALLCAHFNPADGRWSSTVMAGLRLFGVALALLLGLWMLRHRRQGRVA